MGVVKETLPASLITGQWFESKKRHENTMMASVQVS